MYAARPASDLNTELYVVNVDGTNLTRITETSDLLEDVPDWIPESSRSALLKDHVPAQPTVTRIFVTHGPAALCIVAVPGISQPLI